jgi:tetratricopeptide (TPR) repeat protein
VVGDVLGAVADTVKIAQKKVSTGDDQPTLAANQQQVFQQYINFLEQFSQRTPLVLMIDDVHWADTSSVNLLFAAARELQRHRILFIVAYRPDDATAARGGEGHPILLIRNELERYDLSIEVGVPTLTLSELGELLQQRYTGYRTNIAFKEWLSRISGGNVLFITQFLHTLEEDGVIDKESGEPAGDFHHITVPQSVRAAIEERIRRLNDESRELLRYASVEGDTFTSVILAKVTETPQLRLLQKLRVIQQMHHVIQSQGNQLVYSELMPAYRFSHTLLHKAMYDSLDQGEQLLLHQAVFDVLKDQWEEARGKDINIPGLAARIAVHAAILGEHFFAAEVLLQGAKVSWKNYAVEETQALIDNALQSLSLIPRSGTEEQRDAEMLRGELLFQQGVVEVITGNLPGAIEDFREAGAIGERHEDYSLLIQCLLKECKILHDQGSYDEAILSARRALSVAEYHNDYDGQARAHGLLGFIHYARHQFDSAKEHLSLQSELAEISEDLRQQLTALHTTSILYFMTGDYDQGFECVRQSLELARTLGDRSVEAGCLSMVGMWKSQLHYYEEALDYFQQSLVVKQQIGDVANEALVYNMMGMTYLPLGQLDLAQQYLERGITLLKKLGTFTPLPSALLVLSEVYRKTGALDRSVACLEETMELGNTLGQSGFVAEAGAKHALVRAMKAEQSNEPERSRILASATREIEKHLAAIRMENSHNATAEIAEWEEHLQYVRKIMGHSSPPARPTREA